MSLVLVVFLGSFLICEGETDDISIATADVEVGWVGRDEVGETYINVGVSWVDINIKVSWTDTIVEVSWTGSSAVVSELRLIEVLEDVLVLSLVDWWQNKVLISFDFTGLIFKLFA